MITPLIGVPLNGTVGVGSGSSFSLGKAPNIFGKTSGDLNKKPFDVENAVSEDSALSLLNTYASQNQDWLNSYISSGSSVAVFYQDASRKLIFDFYVYKGSKWVKNTSIVAVQGLSGNSVDFSAIPENHVPVVGAAPNKIPYDSGIRILPNGDVLAPKGFSVESGSINFGDLVTVSEIGSYLGITDNTDGTRFVLVDSKIDKQDGSSKPSIFWLQPEESYIIQDIYNNRLSGTTTSVSLGRDFDAQVNSFIFKAYESMVNFRFIVKDSDSGFIHKYYPSKGEYLDGKGVNVASGDFLADLLDTPVRSLPNINLVVEIKADAIKLLGDSSSPYLVVNSQIGSNKSLLLEEDLTSTKVRDLLSSLTGDERLSSSYIKGVDNVDNTKDIDKPLSTAASQALSLKQDLLVSGNSIKTVDGVSLLGSGNIISGSDKLPLGGGTLTGDLVLGGQPTSDMMASTKKYVDDQVKNISSSGTASKLTTERKISLSNDAEGDVLFDGSKDVVIPVTLANSGVSAGSYGTDKSTATVSVNAKGIITSIENKDISFPVTKVAGRTGDISLSKDDVGLSSVDNTSDADKPVSSATAAALSLKQDNLISSTNIKTIDGNAILGSGNLIVGSDKLPLSGGTLTGTLTLDSDPVNSKDAATKGYVDAIETSGSSSKLTTARNIGLAGDITGSTSFDGSQDVSIATVLSDTGVASGTYGNELAVPSIEVDSKGRLLSVVKKDISFPVTSVNTRKGDIVLDKSDVGLNNVDNTSDIDKPISSATQSALDLKVNNATYIVDKNNTTNLIYTRAPKALTIAGYNIGDAYTKTEVDNSLALKADLVDGIVPSSQLPSYVDDVVEFDTLSSFPATGEASKVYIAKDTNLTYRWSGSSYVMVGDTLALGETASTAYRGDRGKEAYDHTLILGTTDVHGLKPTFDSISSSITTLTNRTNTNTNDISTLKTGKADKATTLAGYNISDAYTSTQVSYLLTGKVDLVNGKVQSNVLPDEVKNYFLVYSFDYLPSSGSMDALYCASDTNMLYRWDGSVYQEIGSSLQLGEQSTTAYRGDRGKIAYDHSSITGDTSVHGLKPTFDGISSDIQSLKDSDISINSNIQSLTNSLSTKQDTLVSGTNIKTINGNSLVGSGDVIIGGDKLPLSGGTLTGSLILKSDPISLNEASNKNYVDTQIQNVSLTGSASKLTTPRTITSSGDVSGSFSFDGSQNVTNSLTLKDSGVTSGVYGSDLKVSKITVDSKGRITSSEEISISFPVNSVNAKTGTIILTKADIGLNNVDNTSDLSKPISTLVQNALDLKADKTYVDTALSGKADKSTTLSGYGITDAATKTYVDNQDSLKLNISDATTLLSSKADLVNGLIPSSQLPSYVDDVLSYDSLSVFPVSGEDGKIYLDKTTNLSYRWSGSSYALLDASIALGETSSTAYRGDRGAIAYSHTLLPGNPHNTSIGDIPTLQQSLDSKADLINGFVSSAQLPDNVFNIVEVDTETSLPISGVYDRVYIALDTNVMYRFDIVSSSYIKIGNYLDLGETDTTAFQGSKGKEAYDHSHVTGDKSVHGLNVFFDNLDSEISVINNTLNDKASISYVDSKVSNLGDNVVKAEYQSANASLPPSYVAQSVSQPFNIFTDGSEEFSGDTQIMVNSSIANGNIYGFGLECYDTVTNLRAKFERGGVVLGYYPSKSSWDNGSGDTVTSPLFTGYFQTPISFDAGVLVITLMADELFLKGLTVNGVKQPVIFLDFQSKTKTYIATEQFVIDNKLSLGETSVTAYRGDRGKISYDHTNISGDNTVHGLKPFFDSLQSQIDSISSSGVTFTQAEKTKLSGIDSGASSDRSKHFGTQLTDTVVQETVTTSTAPMLAGDTQKVINNKFQGQINQNATSISNKVDKVSGKSLLSDTEITRLSGIETGATKNNTDSFLVARANHTGTQLSSTVIQSSFVNNSGTFSDGDSQDVINNKIVTSLSNKVDKVAGKGLSANDYTNADKTIVSGVETSLMGKADLDPVTGKLLASQSLGAPPELFNGSYLNNTTFYDENGGVLTPSSSAIYIDSITQTINGSQIGGTERLYRWSGMIFIELSSSLVLGVSSETAYRGDRGNSAYLHSISTGNQHGLTKSDLSLGNVDNTSDLNKPISTLTQNALDLKVDKVIGKQLSTEDFTTALKTKLENISNSSVDAVDVSVSDVTPIENEIVLGDNLETIIRKLNFLVGGGMSYLNTDLLNQPNGICTLDSDALVGTNFLPVRLQGNIKVMGTIDPTAADLSSIISAQGNAYRVTNAGSFGGLSLNAGEVIYFDGSQWRKFVDAGSMTAGSVSNALSVGSTLSFSSGTSFNGSAARTVNVVSAPKLTTATSINGVSFDGSLASYTVKASTTNPLTAGSTLSLTSGTTFDGSSSQTINVVSAPKLSSQTSINGVLFDGSLPSYTIKAATTNPLTIGSSLALSSGTTFDGGTSGLTLNLPTVATAGTYGSSSAAPSITIDNYGRVTSITTSDPFLSSREYSEQYIQVAGGSNVTFTYFGMGNPTVSGTATAVAAADTAFGRVRQLAYLSAASAGSMGGLIAPNNTISLNTGFKFSSTFAYQSGAIANTRLFVGLRAAALANVAGATQANNIGLYFDPSATVFSVISGGASSTVTATTMAVPAVNTIMFRFDMDCAAGSTTVNYKLTQIAGGTSTISGTIPIGSLTTGTFMAPCVQIMSTAAAAVGVSIGRIYTATVV